VNFLPPCKKAPPNQKSELSVTLKKGTYCNGIIVFVNKLTQTFSQGQLLQKKETNLKSVHK